VEIVRLYAIAFVLCISFKPHGCIAFLFVLGCLFHCLISLCSTYNSVGPGCYFGWSIKWNFILCKTKLETVG